VLRRLRKPVAAADDEGDTGRGLWGHGRARRDHERTDGTKEVTYGGHPLYYYAPDSKQGQITGQGLDQFGAPWSVLSPSGREIHTKP
jgi:predicted lipoprotein with Yx(FWY)xxD motif